MRNINQRGLDLIKSFEGCKLESYQDQRGIWTVGYGHTGLGVTPDITISQTAANDLLKSDLERFYHVEDYLSELVNDNQFSALICLAYNIGLGALKISTLLKKINNGESPDEEWLKWAHTNGVINTGLLRRRKAELELYHAVG